MEEIKLGLKSISNISNDDQNANLGTLPKIGEQIFNNCPFIIKQGLDLFEYEVDKESYFVSILALISGALPNYYTDYDDKIFPNLFVYLTGDAASGKGTAKSAVKCFDKVEKYIRENFQKENIIYEGRKSAYDEKVEEIKTRIKIDPNDESLIRELDELSDTMPVPPQRKYLFLPFDNSRANVIQQLFDNNQTGIFFNSEGQDVADAMNNDYNKIRSLFMKAFQHESQTYSRAGQDRKGIDITLDQPKISFLITSTEDQFISVVKNTLDGFYSRILTYKIDSSPKWKDPFSKKASGYYEKMEYIQKYYLDLFKTLSSAKSPIEFVFSKEQRIKFNQHFQEEKYSAYYSEKEMVQLVHRRGLIFTRIAMIFTILNTYNKKQIISGEQLVCDDQDFETVRKLMNIFNWYTTDYYYKLPKPKVFKAPSTERFKSEIIEREKWEKFYRAGVKNARKISIDLYGNESKKSSINRYFKELDCQT